MNISYTSFREALEPFICFSLSDARKQFPLFDRKRLTEWQRKGYIIKIIRENYIFKDYLNTPHLGWFLANNIYKPSYISLQSALSYYGFIPEYTFQTTSISTKRTRILDMPNMRFFFRNLKTSFFFGYKMTVFRENHKIKIAEPEKAILDMLYLEPLIQTGEDFNSLRFNNAVISNTIDIRKMDSYAQGMLNKRFLKRYYNFKEWINAQPDGN